MQSPVSQLKQAERAVGSWGEGDGAQSVENTAVNTEGALQVLIQLPERLSVPSHAEHRQPHPS